MRTAEAFPTSVPRRRPMREAVIPVPTALVWRLRRSVRNGGRSFDGNGLTKTFACVSRHHCEYPTFGEASANSHNSWRNIPTPPRSTVPNSVLEWLSMSVLICRLQTILVDEWEEPVVSVRYCNKRASPVRVLDARRMQPFPPPRLC